MTITCQKKAGSQKIYTVYKDEEPLKEIHISIFGSNPKFHSEEEIAEKEYQGATRYALKQLSARSMLSQKLRELLFKKKVHSTIVDQIINECLEKGYLNDKEWIDSFIRVQRQKRVGTAMIRIKLLQKGVDPEMIPSLNDEHEEKSLHSLLETKYRDRDLSDYKTRQKVIAALQRKGFSLNKILKEIGLETQF